MAGMIDGSSVDIVVEDKKIVDIGPPGTGIGGTIIDYKNNAYVSSGWIDMHVHAFPEFDPYGDEY